MTGACKGMVQINRMKKLKKNANWQPPSFPPPQLVHNGFLDVPMEVESKFVAAFMQNPLWLPAISLEDLTDTFLSLPDPFKCKK